MQYKLRTLVLRRRTSGSRPGPEKYPEEHKEEHWVQGRTDARNSGGRQSPEEEVQQAPTSIKLVNALKEVDVTGDKTESTRRTVRPKTTPRETPYKPHNTRGGKVPKDKEYMTDI